MKTTPDLFLHFLDMLKKAKDPELVSKEDMVEVVNTLSKQMLQDHRDAEKWRALRRVSKKMLAGEWDGTKLN